MKINLFLKKRKINCDEVCNKFYHNKTVEIRLLNRNSFTGNLHYCLTCKKITEEGLHAKLNNEKLGNYYSLKQSLKLARTFNKNTIEFKMFKTFFKNSEKIKIKLLRPNFFEHRYNYMFLFYIGKK